jgi:hypothetical protein
MDELNKNLIYSISLGFIIGIIIFYYYYNHRIKYHGPNSGIIKKKIYKDNDNCYMLKPKIHVCPGGKIIKK